MPRNKKLEPREFLVESGMYPWGPFVSDAPDDALAAACFAKNLLRYMEGHPRDVDGDILLGGKETQLSLAKKADVSQAILSRILRGRSYPDMTTVANLETYVRGRLWCHPAEKYEDFRLI